jgi:hypothetical protein
VLSDQVTMSGEWRGVFMERLSVILREQAWETAPDTASDLLMALRDLQALEELRFRTPKEAAWDRRVFCELDPIGAAGLVEHQWLVSSDRDPSQMVLRPFPDIGASDQPMATALHPAEDQRPSHREESITELTSKG